VVELLAGVRFTLLQQIKIKIMELLSFVIWLCFYPVSCAVEKYVLAEFYRKRNWKFLSETNNFFSIVFNLFLYILIAQFLFFRIP